MIRHLLSGLSRPRRDEVLPESHAVETAARRQGYRVHRLASDFVVIDGAHRRRIGFAGLLGTSVTRPAVTLTEDISLTRDHLAFVGVDCVPCRAQPVSQPPPPWSDVEALAPRLRIRRAVPDPSSSDAGRYVSDESGLLAAWMEMCAGSDREDGQPRVLAEPDTAGEDYDVYLVGPRVLAGFARNRRVGQDPVVRPRMAARPVPPDVTDAAVRAMAAMPGSDYGTVRIHVSSGDGRQVAPRVYSVELPPPPALLGSARLLRLAAETVLEHETGKPLRDLRIAARLRRRLQRGRDRPTARG